MTDSIPLSPEILKNTINMRPSASAREKALMEKVATENWGHVRPYSVLLVSMSNHWAPTAWAKVADMIKFTLDQGIYCGFNELRDRCFEPYDALGTMRNEGINIALAEGYEWLCYVDNDVLPEPDMLIKMLQHPVSIIVPYVVEPGSGMRLHGPHREPNTGLQPIRWSVLSMILFRTNVFHCTGPTFWSDAIGADEGIHFQRLWYYGHRPFVDTNCQLIVSGKPTYPLSFNRMPLPTRAELWEKRKRDMERAPDRRPIDPDNPKCVGDAYMPFAFGEEKKQEELKEIQPEIRGSGDKTEG